MPFSIKDKIREHCDESLEVFKRKGQAIWNAHKKTHYYLNKLITIDSKYEQNYYKSNRNYYKRCHPNHQQIFHSRNNELSFNYYCGEHNQDTGNFKPKKSFSGMIAIILK